MTHRTRLDLGGSRWTVRPSGASVPARVRDAGPIRAVVPGCVHGDLLAAGLIEDPYDFGAEARLAWIGRTDWRYECAFEWTDEGDEWELASIRIERPSLLRGAGL